MSEKKLVGRNIAIVLAIICIVLAAGLVGAVASYTSIISGKDNAIATKDSQISDLQDQKNQTDIWLEGNITYYNSQIATLQSQYDSYVADHHHTDSEYDDLNSQVSNLTDIVNLMKSTVWVDSEPVNEEAGSYVYWIRSATYAGYVSVNVQTSTTDNTYVEVIYYSNGVNYDSNPIVVGTSGTAVFPILPSSSIEIRVGNTNWLNGASQTVSITYYY